MNVQTLTDYNETYLFVMNMLRACQVYVRDLLAYFMGHIRYMIWTPKEIFIYIDVSINNELIRDM